MNNFLGKIIMAAIEEHIKTGKLVQLEDGSVLEESTIKLVDEIVEANRQRKIDYALETRNEVLFMELTKK